MIHSTQKIIFKSLGETTSFLDSQATSDPTRQRDDPNYQLFYVTVHIIRTIQSDPQSDFMWIELFCRIVMFFTKI